MELINPTIQHVIAAIHATPLKLVFEFAGAGSMALCWLHAVPGSSRTLLEATDRYATASLSDLIGTVPTHYVARATAAHMAERAFQRAMRLATDSAPCVGLACTATIATDHTKHGDHQCWIAVYDGMTLRSLGLVLTKGARDRLGEEALIGQMIVAVVAEAAGVALPVPLDTIADERVVVVQESRRDPILALISGTATCVMVAPDGSRTIATPKRGAILSGSFDPLHAGHERLAQVASQQLGLPAFFEMPIVNADKPPLNYAEIERRLVPFRWSHQVLLTRAPLFRDKAPLFPGSVFVLGYDTAARLLDPTYYGSVEKRDSALRAIDSFGCRFLVAGRSVDSVFHTLADLPIPAPLRHLFDSVPQEAFHSDLSSRMIRAQLAQASGAQGDEYPLRTAR